MGVTNMYGAVKYLEAATGAEGLTASDALRSWIENYGELSRRFSWR